MDEDMRIVDWSSTVASSDLMAGRIGNSDIAGVVAVDHGRDPPMLRAELVARRLDFDDLAPLVGVPPGGEAASAEQQEQQRRLEQKENLFPDTRLDVERLRAMDMDVRSEEHTSELQSLRRTSYAVFDSYKKTQL